MSGNEATFYTVSNSRYFLGTVALLNSLRLTGNQGPLVVLDAGLSSLQRDRLSRHCKIAELPVEVGTNPAVLSPFPYCLGATGTIVIVDSDIMVTQSLGPILMEAERGRICAVPDPHDIRRHDEWQELFELEGRPRHQTYVNSGFVAFSVWHWPRLLERWWQVCQRISSERLACGRIASSDPKVVVADGPPRHGNWLTDPVTGSGDQDALNALLMTEFPLEALSLVPSEVEVFTSHLIQARIVDRRTLACTFRGRRTLLLHYNGRPKPWESAAWAQVRRDPYVSLLPRVLLGKGVALRLERRDLPVWLTGGVRGRIAITILDLLHVVFAAVLDRMPVGLSQRVRQALHRLVAIYSRS
jgi:hypothetical protein